MVAVSAGHRLPSSSSGRVFTCIFWISCVSLAAVYCGSLVASMALARKEKIHFETLEELVAQTEYKWGYISGTYLDSVLQVVSYNALDVILILLPVTSLYT